LECSKENVVKVKYNDNSFQICVLEKTEIFNEGKPVFSYIFKDIEDNAYYYVTSDIIFDYVPP
jgi:hypothetical protein